MKKILLFAAVLLAAVSCKNGTKTLLPNVSGKAGEIIVIMDKNNWDGDLGTAVRDVLAGDCPYLAQKEPLYNLANVSPTGFADLFKVHRNIMIFNLDATLAEGGMLYRADVWARPQCVVQLNARDAAEAARVFQDNEERILATFEQAERDRVIANSKLYEEKKLGEAVREMIGGSPHFPSGYKTDPSMGAADIIGLCVIAAVIVFQIWSVMRYQSDNTQVLSGIGIATRVYDTGFLFVAEPVNLFIGAVSFAMRIHPLAFIYGIIPAPLILMYYLCYFEVLRTVCSTWHKTVIAFATVAMLNIWGYQSERLIPVTLLISWFGFWVFLVHGVMNVSAVIIVNYLQTVKTQWKGVERAYTCQRYIEGWR